MRSVQLTSIREIKSQVEREADESGIAENTSIVSEGKLSI